VEGVTFARCGVAMDLCLSKALSVARSRFPALYRAAAVVDVDGLLDQILTAQRADPTLRARVTAVTEGSGGEGLTYKDGCL
jgi:hypothetical protein